MRTRRRSTLDRELARFVKHAYTNAPAVTSIFDAAGVAPSSIKGANDLERIPVTTKDKLVELQRVSPPFGGFLATNHRRVKRVFQSPGPLFEPQGREKTPARVAAEVFKLAGFRRGETALNTLSYHLSPGGWILDRGLERAGVCIVPGGVGNAELQVRTMVDLKVRGYAGTPSFLMTLLKKAEEIGLDVKTGLALEHALFTGEPYLPTLREQFEGVYGLKTTNVYATAELGFLAYECEAHAGLHLADGIIVEFVDTATGRRVGAGEPGEVVVTAFNETYPLVRFGTGDLAAYTDEPCACGRSSPRLTGLLGRVGDAVKVRGMFVHPNQLKMVLAKFPALSRLRGIVTRSGDRDQLELQAESAQPNAETAALEPAIRDAIRELCRVSPDNVTFVAPGVLPREGKLIVDERTWG